MSTKTHTLSLSFYHVSGGRKDEHAVSVNGPRSNGTRQHSSLCTDEPPPLTPHHEKELLNMHGSQCVGSFPLAGHPETNLQKGVMAGGRAAGESNCILRSYRRLTGYQPDTEAGEKRIASLSGFHHSVHTGHWSGRCLLAQPSCRWRST